MNIKHIITYESYEENSLRIKTMDQGERITKERFICVYT